MGCDGILLYRKIPSDQPKFTKTNLLCAEAGRGMPSRQLTAGASSFPALLPAVSVPPASLSSSSKFGADSLSTMAEGGGLSIGCFLYSQADNIKAAITTARSEYFIIRSSYNVLEAHSVAEAISSFKPGMALCSPGRHGGFSRQKNAVPKDGLF